MAIQKKAKKAVAKKTTLTKTKKKAPGKKAKAAKKTVAAQKVGGKNQVKYTGRLKNSTAKVLTSLPRMTAPAKVQQDLAQNGAGLRGSSVLKITVPDIPLPATGGQTVNLKQLAQNGKKIVLYFYPKDMTPGCTIEGHEFTRLKDQFADQNAVVFGVSRDTVDLHEKFKAKECYTIELLSDVDEKLCEAFAVIKDKNMYGKMVRGIERSTFIIDENGQVVKEWRGVKAEGHAQQVLEFLTSV